MMDHPFIINSVQPPKDMIVRFYHEREENGCFSNWYPASFEYAGQHYNCVEQYMMYQKVLMFRQYHLAEKILASNNPSEIKRLGRTRFPEFNSDVWDRTSYAIVKRGVRAKFEQNKDLLQVLLDTQDNVLAECSLMDKKWGIGVAIDNPDCSDPSKWNGKNYLGRILMEVRDELRRLSAAKKIGYVDAKELQFPLWNSFAGVLRCNPKLYPVINAYCDTLPRQDIQSCFLYDYSLYQWEIAMHTNMGGGLPAIGFWEMKQDIYETLRI